MKIRSLKLGKIFFEAASVYYLAGLHLPQLRKIIVDISKNIFGIHILSSVFNYL